MPPMIQQFPGVVTDPAAPAKKFDRAVKQTFSRTLADHRLTRRRGRTEILQLNVGNSLWDIDLSLSATTASGAPPVAVPLVVAR